ncbi:MAG: protein phosphatase 2C domain-containing protein [Deltaproteobacteria bacterium]|nr:protein phosphatase 2C domain-containing protein [Deltaproteobacteria bacterium]
MKIQSNALTDVGLKRDHNEDACVADDAHGIFVVCDGMGGAAAGEVASAMALDRVTEFFRPRVAELRTGDMQSPAFRQRLVRLADAAIQDACQHVYKAASDGVTGRVGMGTTLTLLVLIERVAVVGHVGDSRMYLRRNNILYPLTRDHSFVNEMVSRGALTPEEALKHPMANLLSRAVGPQGHVDADTNVLDVYDDDLFFLCTDGVTKGVNEAAMLECLGAKTLEASCKNIIDAANAAGGDDNSTAVLVRVNEGNEGRDPNRETIEGKHKVLDALPLFAGLAHSELTAVVSVAGVRTLAPDEVISRAGHRSDHFYVLVRGQAVLRLLGADVLVVKPGQHFGDVEMFDGKPAMLEAVATEPSVVLTFERAHLEDLFRRDPELGVKLMWRFAAALSGRVDEVLRRGTLTE